MPLSTPHFPEFVPEFVPDMKTPFDDLAGPAKWWAVITAIVAAGTVALLVWYVLIPVIRGEPLSACPPTMQGCDSPSYNPRGT